MTAPADPENLTDFGYERVPRAEKKSRVQVPVTGEAAAE